MPRILSLIASSTEILCALGFQHHLVGRSHECDWPLGVSSLPVCTTPRFDVHGTSQQIDDRVKDILRLGLSVYEVRTDELQALKPDIIVTQTQCEVCAVSLSDVEAALQNWLGRRPALVSLAPNALADVWDDIQRVATALKAPSRGVDLVARMKADMEAIAVRCAAEATRPTVACIEWISPLMASGNWMPELIEKAGSTNLFGTAGQHAPWMTMADLCAADPDVVLVLPCGFDIARTREEMGPLWSSNDFCGLRAVRFGQVYLLDGNQYFNRPGPRLVDSLQILAEILHPSAFPAAHKPSGWEVAYRPTE